MKRYILTILIGIHTFQAHSQASKSSDFQLKVKFDNSISVSKIQPYYSLKNGNSMEEIFYELDSIENSITLSGRNHYILEIPFPLLVFTLSEEVKLPHLNDKVERTFVFYLISDGFLLSYTGDQTKDIRFSYNQATILASLDHRNYADTFKNLKLENKTYYPGYYSTSSFSNEIIKIRRGKGN